MKISLFTVRLVDTLREKTTASRAETEMTSLMSEQQVSSLAEESLYILMFSLSLSLSLSLSISLFIITLYFIYFILYKLHDNII